MDAPTLFGGGHVCETDHARVPTGRRIVGVILRQANMQ